MDLMDAIRSRHSVRHYKDIPLEEAHITELNTYIRTVNEISGLHIQLIVNEPVAFSTRLARYGKFRNVKNYIALIGKDTPQLAQLCGYYGEQIVLKAQTMGLNTCWVGMTYSGYTPAYKLRTGEKLLMVIAIGYGEDSGKPHKMKSIDAVISTNLYRPDWFMRGAEAALMAPTALNRQKFVFVINRDDEVRAKTGLGPFNKVGLGIAMYHFEIGAGKENFTWKN